MKVGVTGGYGFIGGHLVKRLLHDGHEVVVLDNMRRPQHRLRRHPALSLHRGDIRNFQDLHVFADCQVIINLAAESSVLQAEANADYARETNIHGVANLAKFCSELQIRLVQASSREVYGEVSELPVKESTPLAAKNLYGKSKVVAEDLLLTSRKNSQLVVTIFRFSNVIGTHDAGRLLPLWLRAASQGKPLTIFGGEQVIDFIPVEVAVDALMFSLDHDLPLPVNIGSGQSISVLALAQHIQSLFPHISLDVQPARSIEVTGYQADITQMIQLGLYRPISFKKYLKKLSHYYR